LGHIADRHDLGVARDRRVWPDGDAAAAIDMRARDVRQGFGQAVRPARAGPQGGVGESSYTPQG
jgi:hypothetical protein